MQTAAEIEAFLHRKIPLSVAMGVRVAELAGDRLVLEAPLPPNRNHLETAFGGSLGALATLAGYTLLWVWLGDAQAHIVIRESRISFLKPVRTTLRATCLFPRPERFAPFREQFLRHGKSRISLQVTIAAGAEGAVEFEGVFVALRTLKKD